MRELTPSLVSASHSTFKLLVSGTVVVDVVNGGVSKINVQP